MSPREHDTAGLRDLVGPASSAVGPGAITSGPSLAELVGSVERVSRASTVDLRDVVGPSTIAPAARNSSGTLAALVGEGGVRATEGGWSAPERATPGRRRLFDGASRTGISGFVSAALAVGAVAAVVLVASFAVYQRLTVNPADEAMVSLVEDEAQLKNETKVLDTAKGLFDVSATEAASLVEAATPVLAAVQPEVNPGVWGAANASREELARRAAAPPTVGVEPYRRGDINEKSLTQVGAAIERVRLARAELPEAITEVRQARENLVAAIDGFRGRLRDVAGGLQSSAAANVQDNRAAADSFRAAVTDSAAQLGAVLGSGGDGLAEMTRYKAALDALRAENARVVELRSSTEEDLPRAYVPPSGSTPAPSTPSPTVPSEPTPSESPSPSPETSTPPSSPPSEPSASADPGAVPSAAPTLTF